MQFVETTTVKVSAYEWRCQICDETQQTKHNPNIGNAWDLLCPGCVEIRKERVYQVFHRPMMGGRLHKIRRMPGEDSPHIAASACIITGDRCYEITADGDALDIRDLSLNVEHGQ